MEVKLSASRIKTAQSCSWLYWSKYVKNYQNTVMMELDEVLFVTMFLNIYLNKKQKPNLIK